MTQQRKHLRIDFQTNVTLNIDDTIQTGTTLNISQGGILLYTAPPLSFGQKIILEIQLPKMKEVCRIPSVVRWCNEDKIGIQFEVLRAIEVWAINQLAHQSK